MAKKADKQQASALDEVRRHVRIFVDLGRVASESADEDGFLDQVVVQVARAVEIDHVKVLRYRRREADLLIAAGFGWKEGVVRSATLLPICGRKAAGILTNSIVHTVGSSKTRYARRGMMVILAAPGETGS
jgi:hypothetical protein